MVCCPFDVSKTFPFTLPQPSVLNTFVASSSAVLLYVYCLFVHTCWLPHLFVPHTFGANFAVTVRLPQLGGTASTCLRAAREFFPGLTWNDAPGSSRWHPASLLSSRRFGGSFTLPQPSVLDTFTNTCACRLHAFALIFACSCPRFWRHSLLPSFLCCLPFYVPFFW
jgi:hypothetical protein